MKLIVKVPNTPLVRGMGYLIGGAIFAAALWILMILAFSF